MKKYKHKHEFRQKIVGGCDSCDHGGYYCIHCLLEVKNKKDLEKK